MVLTRKAHERILIGDDITVEVLEMRPGKVRLGVMAPREVRVDREETREAKDVAARAAGTAGLAR